MSRREFLENWATMDIDNMEEAKVMYASTKKDAPWNTEKESDNND